MTPKKFEKQFKRIHAGLVPKYNEVCRAHGIENPPSVCWASIASHDHVVMLARVVWDGDASKAERLTNEMLADVEKADAVGSPHNIAERVAAVVIKRLASRN